MAKAAAEHFRKLRRFIFHRITSLEMRAPRNVLIIAIANKLARIPNGRCEPDLCRCTAEVNLC